MFAINTVITHQIRFFFVFQVEECCLVYFVFKTAVLLDKANIFIEDVEMKTFCIFFLIVFAVSIETTKTTEGLVNGHFLSFLAQQISYSVLCSA